MNTKKIFNQYILKRKIFSKKNIFTVKKFSNKQTCTHKYTQKLMHKDTYYRHIPTHTC
jgi:hypothetical protein